MKDHDDLYYQVQLYKKNRNLCPVVFVDEKFEPYPKCDRYLVSTYGRLYDTKKKVMKTTINRGTNEYYDFSLSPGHNTSCTVQQMVMATFNPDIPDGVKKIRHKNGNPKDNRLSNLEWAE